MASKRVASALTIFTSERFTPSDIADNNALETFVFKTSLEVGKSPMTTVKVMTMLLLLMLLLLIICVATTNAYKRY